MTLLLDYSRLYGIAEELCQLVGCPLQAVHGLSETRFALDFRLPGQSRWLVLDLTPGRPFIVSVFSAKSKGKGKISPAGNFMKAHFVGSRLSSVEIAQKPNRTLRLSFLKAGGEAKTMTFKCFPHGQHLMLFAGEKFVQTPLRPRQDEEVVAFVEPEKQNGWEENEKLAAETLEAKTGDEKSVRGLVPYHSKLIKKLEKAIAALDEGAKTGRDGDEARIAELNRQADALKSGVPEKGAPSAAKQGGAKVDSRALEKIYDEIKRVKRKHIQLATRRNELVAQLEKLRSEPQPADAGSRAEEQRPSKKIDDGFSGTRVRLDGVHELWIGRSDWQNDDLVRLAGPHELWIHLRDYAGAHGVIRGPKKSEPSLSLIEFSCRIVAQMSRSKKKPFAEGEWLDFIVTPRKFVKKPKGAAAGRVIVERESVRRVAYKTVKFEPI